MRFSRWVAALIVGFAAAASSGCAGVMDVVLPPHPNSLSGVELDDEEVTATLLTAEEVLADSKLTSAYVAAFEIPPPTEGEPSALAAGPTVASAVIGLVGDAVVGALETEAERYAAAWKLPATTLENQYVKRPYAIRVERRTRGHGLRDANLPAVTATFGVSWKNDKGEAAGANEVATTARFALLGFEMNASKAKVLHWREWSWLPPLLVMQILQDQSDAVDVVLAFKAESGEKVAAQKFEVDRYSIDESTGRKARWFGEKGMPGEFMTLTGLNEKPTISLSVGAAEGDSIHAGRYIKKLAERLGDKFDALAAKAK